MREKSALASVGAFEIMEADDDINIFVKDMNVNDGERHPRGEKRRRVGNDQKVKVDDREQHWQNYLKVLSKTSKECEGLLKNEYTKFQATHDKFCKEKAAHMQTFKGELYRFLYPLHVDLLIHDGDGCLLIGVISTRDLVWPSPLISFSRWRPDGHCRRLGASEAWMDKVVKLMEVGADAGDTADRGGWEQRYIQRMQATPIGGGRGGRLAYIGDATTGLGEGDDRDGRKRRSDEHWQKKRPWRKPEERGAPPSMDDGSTVSDSASSPATN
uniref:Uncharacterized protein n=1 Tax=Oryza nivara TaxID=4536 RepID=A0A0E0HLV8_ORYNI